jgi:hypothetical protein
MAVINPAPANPVLYSRRVFAALSLLLAVFLSFFYVRYVPLVPPFQLILVPVLLAGTFFMLQDVERGVLFFAAAFLLINNLPYYFGIHEHIPHAPISLVLFLFVLLGWLVHYTFHDFHQVPHHQLVTPLLLFAGMVALSAVITAGRYVNFFPFLTDAVYEWNTNVTGVSSGGAVMSVLFSALNYLTGFGVFAIVLQTARSRAFLRLLVTVILISLSFSLLLGYYQAYADSGFGNTPFWETLRQINATFKDPNAFAAVLVTAFPLILGLAVMSRGWTRVFPLTLLAAGLFLYPQIGNRSSLLGLGFGGLVFAGVMVWIRVKRRTGSIKPIKRVKNKILLPGLFAAAFIMLVGGSVLLTDSRLLQRTQIVGDVIKTRGSLISISPERYFLWKEAVHLASLHPLTSVGIGAYIIELPNYYSVDDAAYPEQLEIFRRIDSAENYFLHVWAEMGWGGLLLSFWLFGGILAGMIKVFRRLDPGSPFAPLQAGAAAAVAAYIPNLFFHSYVGSFEAKAMFWMAVAVLFSFQAMDESQGGKRRSRTFRMAGIAFLAVFAALFLWQSTHSLSLESRSGRFDIRQDFGFYQIEKTESGREFRWTKKTSGKTIEIEDPVLTLMLHASHPDIRENPVSVDVFLVEGFFRSKKPLETISIRSEEWSEYEIPVRDYVGRKMILLLQVSRTWNPLKEKGVLDPRDLGVAVGVASLKRLGSAAGTRDQHRGHR